MKAVITIGFVLFAWMSFTQESFGSFKTVEGETVKMYPNKTGKSKCKYEDCFKTDFWLNGQHLYYYNEKGKLITASQKDITEMTYGDSTYVQKKIKGNSGFNRLHEVIIKNDKYMLTQYYFQRAVYVYLWEIESGNCLVVKRTVSFNKKKDLQFYNSVLKTKFKDCKEFLKKVASNMNVDYAEERGKVLTGRFKIMLRGINNWTCN